MRVLTPSNVSVYAAVSGPCTFGHVQPRTAHGPPTLPPRISSIAARCAASARSSITTRASPLPSWIAPGQLPYTEKFSPSSVTSPAAPSSTCHVQPPSHLPVVGRALKLQGQPQSQLHATTTFPLSFQLSVFIRPPHLAAQYSTPGSQRCCPAPTP